jgi:MtN3 and saliva related transmembrane protein
MQNFSLVSLLGLLGAITASSIFIPQVLASYKNKKTKDIAWFTIAIGLANGVFWTSYGFLKLDPFIYVTNIISFVATLLLMLLKRKHG